MTELERKIREDIRDFCGDTCAEHSAKALLGVLDLHKSDDDDHMCVKYAVGYTIQAWYGDPEDCPTVLAIAKGLGLISEEN